MSHQRIVASRCSASSSSASAAVPCIHRPFEDPPSCTSRCSGPAVAAAFPDSTAALLHRPPGRGKAPVTDVAGGLLDSLQMRAVDWSNTSAGSSANSSAVASAAAGFCADGVDSSSSDSELQYSKDTCNQNSSADDCTKKRMINIPTYTFPFYNLMIQS